MQSKAEEKNRGSERKLPGDHHAHANHQKQLLVVLKHNGRIQNIFDTVDLVFEIFNKWTVKS